MIARPVYVRSGTDVYIHPDHYGYPGLLRLKLKTKYSTPRIFILNKAREKFKSLNLENGIVKIDPWFIKEIIHLYQNECCQEVATEYPFSVVTLYCNAFFRYEHTEDNIRQAIIQAGCCREVDRLEATRLQFCLEPSSLPEWLLTLLLEGLDTEFIAWVDNDKKIFKILQPQQLHTIFNKYKTYYNMPTSSFNFFKLELKSYCVTSVLIEIDPRDFVYQFDNNWYQKEINNEHSH